jgi:hypothetical protein
VDANIVFQEGNAEEPDHVQSKDDHDDSADLGQPCSHIDQKAAQGGSHNIEEDKDQAEAEHERQAVCKGDLSARVFGTARRGATAQVANIGRHQ